MTTAGEEDLLAIGEIYRQRFYSEHTMILSWTPRPFAVLSILGSTFIIRDVLWGSRTKRDKMSNRIMLGLSCSDVLFSTLMFVSSWAVPSGQAYGSMGTVTTCTAQGFLNAYACIASQFYNASLALCYLLMVRYGWNEKQLRNIQSIFLAFPVFIALPFTVPSLFWDAYNFDGVNLCSGIAPYPLWCDEGDVPCIRGGQLVRMIYKNKNLWAAFTPQILCGSVILTSMILLYITVLKNERANDRYRFEGSANREHSNRVAMQGIFYILAFMLTWCTWIVLIALQITGRKVPFALQFVSLILMPLQGFFNSIVYLRPRCLYYEGEKENDRGLFRQYSRRAARLLKLNRDCDDLSATSQKGSSGDSVDEYALDPSTVFLLPPKEIDPAPMYGTATRVVELPGTGLTSSEEKEEIGSTYQVDESRPSINRNCVLEKDISACDSCLSISTVDA